MNHTLYIVVPCYNEEEVLDETSRRLKEKLTGMIQAGSVSRESRILFVDDGSRDKTWELIDALHRQDPIFSGVKLAGNKGHQNALLAGLMTAKERADVVISMDADLQDDIDAVDRFVEKYYEGCDIVYGVRSERTTDTAFKRGTAQGFYKMMDALGVKIVYNHADYRLMSRRALEGLSEFREVNLFLRGIVPLIGYKTATVEYARGERFAGESKYPLKKMLAFAMDGVTSFSVKPIAFITGVGVVLAATGGLFGLYSLIAKLAGWWYHPSWILIFLVWFIGGLQLTALGVVGEYIGKIYKEVKARPRYIIETVLDQEKQA
ncbi:glycosyltransferase family 2 protein [Oscillospiraceae bacterium MB08-C2-2]|nr:glycosyltransferase family 2 protein [Oscillospiraceae bacterium MB08-C2-2]